MTTITQFTPPRRTAFSFSALFDGDSYTVQIRWNVMGQRWYVNVFDVNSNRIYTGPMVGSSNGLAVTSMIWDGLRQIVVVQTATPHGIKLGVVVEQTIRGVTPSAFNGTFLCVATGPSTLVYPQTVDPGDVATIQGSIGYDLNLVAGIFQTSTLVYRESSSQFEVSP